MTMRTRQIPILIRFLYFLAFGLWFGGLCAVAGWLLCITVIGLPFGIWVLHRLPLVTTLTMPDEEYVPIKSAKDYRHAVAEDQFPFLVRALWFGLVGWWLAGLTIKVAFLLSASIVFSPIGFWMINRVPAVLTLEGV